MATTVTNLLQNYTLSNSSISTRTSGFHVNIVCGFNVKTTDNLTVIILYPLLFLVGIFGNGLLMLIVIRNKNLRTVPNVLIVNLALGDFLLILIATPTLTVTHVCSLYPFGAFVCKLNSFLQELSGGVSIFTLVLLSADRYKAIASPMNRYRYNMKRRTVAMVVVIWCLAMVLALPELYFKELYTYGTIKICRQHNLFIDNEGAPLIYNAVKFVLYFAIPVVIIGAFYICMALALVKSAEHLVEGQSESQHQRDVETRKRVARIVLGLVVLFIICWLPRYVYQFCHWSYCDFSMDFFYTLMIIQRVLIMVNSCVNPVALYVLSKTFRVHFNKYLCYLCIKTGVYREQEASLRAEGTIRTTVPAAGTSSRSLRSLSPVCLVTLTKAEETLNK